MVEALAALSAPCSAGVPGTSLPVPSFWACLDLTMQKVTTPNTTTMIMTTPTINPILTELSSLELFEDKNCCGFIVGGLTDAPGRESILISVPSAASLIGGSDSSAVKRRKKDTLIRYYMITPCLIRCKVGSSLITYDC